MTRDPVVRASWRLPLAFVAVVSAFVVAALALTYAGTSTAGPLDGAVRPESSARSSVRVVALVIDFGGEPVGAALLLAVLVAVCLALRRGRAAVLAVAGPALAVAVTSLLKPVVLRTIHDGHLSFPSGHTAYLTALALVAALVLAEEIGTETVTGMVLVAAATVLAGAAMAWSQVTLGAHYPTDTFGGFCTALATVPPAASLIDRPWQRCARAQ